MKKLSVKNRILNALKNETGYNTFTVKSARNRFGVKNIAARIEELRQEGHVIYTNTRKTPDGDKITYYRLGTPTKSMIRAARAMGWTVTA